VTRINDMLTQVAAGAGAVGWKIVRQNKHLIVDFEKPDGSEVRTTVSVTASDHRAMRNKITQLRKIIKGH
jgi:hypothetical protein